MKYSMLLSERYVDPAIIDVVDKTNKVKVTDVLLMFFLLSISGNPFFVLHYDLIVACSIVIPLIYAFTNSYKKITFSTVFIFTFLLGYELMHALVYSLDYSLTIFKLALVLLLAFAAVQIIGNRFIKTLTVTMVIITLISFVFSLLCYVPGLNWELYHAAERMFPIPQGFKDYTTPTFLIYTMHPQYFTGEFDYVRNAGIFWESGAFAVFLNLTLYLRYITKRIAHVGDLFDKTSVLLIVGLLTTASTMGFLALMVILTFFTMQLRTPLKYVFLLLVAAMSYLTFVSVDFLGDKIATQLEESDERNNRFGAFLMDWQDIKKRPIIGSSRRIEVIYGTAEHSMKTRRPNGFSNFLREYGLIYFAAYFIMIFYSFKRIFHYHQNYFKNSYALFGVVLLWLLSFSEIIFDLPFFKALIFVGMMYFPQQEMAEAEQEEGLVLETETETA
jgi:hypothetical protein